MKPRMYLLFSVGVSCFAPVAGADCELREDFDVGDLWDCQPVCWEKAPCFNLGSEFEQIDGSLFLSSSQGLPVILEAAQVLEGDMTVRVDVSLMEPRLFAVVVNSRCEGGGYLGAVSVAPGGSGGQLQLLAWNGQSFLPSLKELEMSFDAASPHSLQLDVVGDELELRFWPAGDPMPEAPRLVAFTASDPLSGRVSLVYWPSCPDTPAIVHSFSAGAEDCPCSAPPARVRRTLWDDRIEAERTELPFFEPGGEYRVRLHVSPPAGPGTCDPGSRVRIEEVVPDGWSVASLDPNAGVAGDIIWWELDLAEEETPELDYTLTAGPGEIVNFEGNVRATVQAIPFEVEGEERAIGAGALAPISDFGSIQHWLILGPFLHDCRPFGEQNCARPGEEQVKRDYLADGTTTEVDLQPREGDTIAPDYGGVAASTGLAPNERGLNPGDVPTWLAWRDLDDENDRIDFESIYGPVDNVLGYAVTYLDVAEDVDVWLGVSSDDSIHLLLDGRTIHARSIGRRAAMREYQDTPLAYPCVEPVDSVPCLGPIVLEAGRHTLMVKVFDGFGGHNFRIGFVDGFGQPIPGGPGGIEISLSPTGSVEFVRGDCTDDGTVNIADSVCILDWLFSGVGGVSCSAALDVGGDGNIDLSDAISLFAFLFGGGAMPVEPFPDCGPGRRTVDEKLSCASSRCE